MSGLFLKKQIKKAVSLGMILAMTAGMTVGCGKKDDTKSDVDDVKSISESAEETNDEAGEASGENKDRTDELVGVWQLNADTPAGDPYVFQIEVSSDKHLSYCGYSMTGERWFQNFCYDGSIEQERVAGLGDDAISEYFIENEDGSFDAYIEASELDENGTETDRISCKYNVSFSGGNNDSVVLKYLSGDYIGFEETDEAITFEKVLKAIEAGDFVMESDGGNDAEWKNAYWEFLNELKNEPFDAYGRDYFSYMPDSVELLDILDGRNAVSYYLYDMDNDSTPELIVLLDNSDEDTYGLIVKSTEDGVLNCYGGYLMEYSDIYSDPDNSGVIRQTVNMGVSEITKLYILDDCYETEVISTENYNGHGDPIYDRASDVVKGARLLVPKDIDNIENLRSGKSADVPTDEQIRLLEEAISIFPVDPVYAGGFNSYQNILNSGWEILANWRNNAGDERGYAGLVFETGKKNTPDEVFSAYGYFDAGDLADYVRTDTEMLEYALQSFFDTDTNLNRSVNPYDCKVDDNFVTLWGEAYKEPFAFSTVEWLSFKNHMEDDTLIIDAVRQGGDSVEINESAMRFWFYQNPDSLYGYTLIDYETVRTETKVLFTLEQIKESEKFIRSFVNGNSSDKSKISIKAGTDGCPYARDFYYINSTPIFAFYYSATDGSVDNRYYFEVENMIEWIEGSGNDDSNRERHYSCDSPLDSRWKETEKTVLADAKYYGKQELGFVYFE